MDLDATQRRRLLQTTATTTVLCNAKCQSQVGPHVPNMVALPPMIEGQDSLPIGLQAAPDISISC